MAGERSHGRVLRFRLFWGQAKMTCPFARQIPEEEAAVQRRGRAGFFLVSIAGGRRGNLGSRNVPTERIPAPVALRRARRETLVSLQKGKVRGLRRARVAQKHGLAGRGMAASHFADGRGHGHGRGRGRGRGRDLLRSVSTKPI